VRLAHVPGCQGDKTLKATSDTPLPSLLVSYVYNQQFVEKRSEYQISEWVMDSGAFTAYNSGIEICVDKYIEECHRLKKEDPTLVEIFALDVIGDWKASMKNTEKMWEAGVEAVPCYHEGEPEQVLLDLAKRFPKIALGGVANTRGPKKDQWAAQCFARVWPKRIHGFGFGSKRSILGLPWHTTDATNWELGPCKFGSWASYGRANLGIRGSNHPLQVEIDYYMNIQRDAQSRWRREMELVESLP